MHHLDYYTIGQKIKKRRLDRGLSQEKAAELCDISASFYGNIERGTKIMSLDTFVDICQALQISPDYILLDELPDTDPIIMNIISEVKKIWFLTVRALPAHHQGLGRNIRQIVSIYNR